MARIPITIVTAALIILTLTTWQGRLGVASIALPCFWSHICPDTWKGPIAFWIVGDDTRKGE